MGTNTPPIVLNQDMVEVFAKQIFEKVNNRIDERIVSDTNSDNRHTLSVEAIKTYVEEFFRQKTDGFLAVKHLTNAQYEALSEEYKHLPILYIVSD